SIGRASRGHRGVTHLRAATGGAMRTMQAAGAPCARIRSSLPRQARHRHALAHRRSRSAREPGKGEPAVGLETDLRDRLRGAESGRPVTFDAQHLTPRKDLPDGQRSAFPLSHQETTVVRLEDVPSRRGALAPPSFEEVGPRAGPPTADPRFRKGGAEPDDVGAWHGRHPDRRGEPRRMLGLAVVVADAAVAIVPAVSHDAGAWHEGAIQAVRRTRAARSGALTADHGLRRAVEGGHEEEGAEDEAPARRQPRSLGSGRLGERLGHAVEELIEHHLAHAAQHPLAHAGDEAAHLHVRVVADARAALDVRELHARLAPDEAGAAAAFQGHFVAVGGLEGEEADLPLERTLDGGHAVLHLRFVSALANLVQPLTAGESAGEKGRIEKGFPPPLARRRYVVRAFDLHPSSLPTAAAMRLMPSLIVSSPV